MFRCLTAHQRELVDRAGTLADRFAERAATNGEQNRFPYENYDNLREAGFLGLTVPAELGGLGAGLPEILPGAGVPRDGWRLHRPGRHDAHLTAGAVGGRLAPHRQPAPGTAAAQGRGGHAEPGFGHQ